MLKKKKKLYFLSKISIYFSLGLRKERQSYRISLDPRAKEKVKYFKTNEFSLLLWVILALLDPDPHPVDQNKCGSGSGSTTLEETVQNLPSKCGNLGIQYPV